MRFGAALSPFMQCIFERNLVLNHQMTCFWVRVLYVAEQLPPCSLWKVSPGHKFCIFKYLKKKDKTRGKTPPVLSSQGLALPLSSQFGASLHLAIAIFLCVLCDQLVSPDSSQIEKKKNPQMEVIAFISPCIYRMAFPECSMHSILWHNLLCSWTISMCLIRGSFYNYYCCSTIGGWRSFVG